MLLIFCGDPYLRHVGHQILPWEDTEIEKFSAIIASLRPKLAPWDLRFPKTVLLVKTTGREEGGAAYTRGNGIVLPLRYVVRPSAPLEDTLLHEMFHVLSRSNPALRKALYETIGFHPCGDIELPESLKPRKITNPDSVGGDYALHVSHGGVSYEVIPVLLASTMRNVAGRSIFSSMTFRLMAVEQKNGHWAPQLVDGKPLLFEHTELHGFYEQIGRNTEYVIHPEEILAENFVLLINQMRDVPTPRVLQAMTKLLQKQ